MKLNLQIILIVIVPIIVFSAIISVLVFTIISDQLLESTIQKIKVIALLESTEMKNPISNLDIDKLNEIIDTIELNESVLQVLVLFPDGKIITDGTDKNLNFGNVLKGESILSDEEQILIKKETVRISTPILLDEKIGILVIDFSLKSLNMMIQELYLQVGIVSLTLIAIFTVISLLFSRTITVPIMKIKTYLEKISKGKYEHTSEKFSILELQELNEDIEKTNRKLQTFQKELIKNERLSTIGELSARISHDLRNPLTIIKNAVDLINIKNPEFVKTNHQYFSMINSAIDRMNADIKGVLSYTKTQIVKKSLLPFSNIVEDVLISVNIPKNIHIIKPKDYNEICCYQNQFENVLSNLIINSVQSIGENSGEITINLKKEDDFDKITVSDNGPGIPKDSLDTIFEPLYTTKQHGTGLGLVNCKNIIQYHDGKIFAENLQPGARFTILIPQHKKKSTNSQSDETTL